MKKGASKLIIILISVIIILVLILGYGFYTGMRVKAELENLHSQINQLSSDKDVLQNKYNLLEQDVAKIYKTCMNQNACKGRFPNVSWYCNNVGDESSYAMASHVCICDASCNLNLTQISR
jgi:hypothetical protein